MTNEKKNEPKKPTHRAYSVRESKKQGGKGFWTPIGAAWQHDDGKGFNINIDLFPKDGKIVLRTIEEKTESDDE